MSIFGAKKLYELLQVEKGVTALIGGGGKTSLMYQLAGELRGKGTVLICTTTHIRKPEQFPFAETAEEAAALLEKDGIACVGTQSEEGKLTAPSFDGWETMADYVIVEADGAKMRPLKAHAEHEPVIPAGCGNAIYVVGMSGFGQPIAAAAHRPERYAALAGVGELTKVTPEIAATVIRTEGLHTRVFLNQTDTAGKFFGAAQMKEFAKELGCPVVVGSLRQGIWQKLK